LSLGEQPERDLCAGWERFLDWVALLGEATPGAALLATEGAFAPGFGKQVARVGDLVDNVLEEFIEVRGGKAPPRR
jgi:hypothetical protein